MLWRLAKEGYVGQEESDKLIQELLNAKIDISKRRQLKFLQSTAQTWQTNI